MAYPQEYKSIRSILTTLRTLREWHALRTHLISQLAWLESRGRKTSLDLDGPIPWWPYSLTHFLDQTIPTDWSVLEIGSGASTLWWNKRGNTVTSIETSEYWASRVLQDAPRPGNLSVRVVSEVDAAHLKDALGEQKFDVVVNDGHGDRNSIASVLCTAVSHRGVFIWDNSDRIEYRDGLNQIDNLGFQRLEFFGMVPIVAYATQSTLFMRNPIEVNGRTISFPVIAN